MAFLAFVQALLAWTFGILHPTVGLSEGLALRSLPISPHPQKKEKKFRLALVVAFRRMILLKPNLPPTQTREATERENSATGEALSDSAIYRESQATREPMTWTRAGTLRCNFDLSAIPREVWHYHWAEAGREKLHGIRKFPRILRPHSL